jgi:type III restriction enzyme
MANESFAEFADTLQREIEEETGVKFGVLQLSLFSGLTFTETVTEEKTVTTEQAEVIVKYVKQLSAPVPAPSTATKPEPSQLEPVKPPPPPAAISALTPVIEKAVAAAQMGAEVTVEKIAKIKYNETREVEQTVSYDDAQDLLTHFEKKGYVTKSGVVKDTMKEALAAGTLDLPAKFEAARQKFETVISKANTRPPVQDASKEVRVRLKKQVMISPEFVALWERIKGRTSYRVTIDENLLKERAIQTLIKMEKVPKARIVNRTAKVNLENAGVFTSGEYERTQDLTNEGHRLPNFLRAVDDDCFLSRRSAVEVLTRAGRIDDYLNNPQKMTEMFIEAVCSVQNTMEIDGIRYHRLDGDEFYLQEIFDSEELVAYLDRNAIAVDNSIYDHIIYDSTTVERPFAVALDSDPDVKMFFKIPNKFKIETPIGTYNPDWAVYMDRDGEEKLYFVLETKGVSGQIGFEELATSQRQKIHCGTEHFAALNSGVVFSDTPVKDWRAFKTGM